MAVPQDPEEAFRFQEQPKRWWLSQHWEKARYSLKEICNKRPLMARKNTNQVPFSSVETLLDGCSVWCYDLLIAATCSSSRIAGRQPCRHDMGSTW